MLKRIIYLFFLLSTIKGVEAQVSDNHAFYGTFESADDVEMLKEFSYTDAGGHVWANSRYPFFGQSSLAAHSGAYSLLIASNVSIQYFPCFPVSPKYEKGILYFARVWVYFPSQALTIDGVTYSNPTPYGGARFTFLNKNGNLPVGCGQQNAQLNEENYNKWLQASFTFDNIASDFTTALVAATGSSTQFFYYLIDDMEIAPVSSYPAIVDNANFIEKNGRTDIVLNPKYGLPDVPYQYEWWSVTEAGLEKLDYTGPVAEGLSGGTYKVRVKQGYGTCYSFDWYYTVDPQPLSLCEMVIPSTSGGKVKLDKSSGQIVFQRGDPSCLQNIEVGCIQGKIDLPQLNNVVSSSATTYANTWSYAYLSEQHSSNNSIERGEVGKWRQQSGYTFNRNLLSNDKNYNSGRYTLSRFNYENPQVNSKTGWVKDSEVMKYSPHGDVVEERDALNIASTAKFGYHDNVPYLIAKNAAYNDVLFESFENSYKNKSLLEDGTPVIGGNVDEGTAHTGTKSYKIQSQAPFTTRTFSRSTALETRGVLIRFWAKGSALGADVLTAQLIEKGQSAPRAFKPFTQLARAGEWSLWQARFAPGEFSLANVSNTFTAVISSFSAGDIWIDDVRIQPLDAEMTCYVYDPRTLKLLAALDDQHFAMLYQYNSEGQLVRKMVETERGVKTVQETQYNLPKTTKSAGE